MKINFLGYFLSFTQVIQCFNETINQAVVSVDSNETNRVKRVAEYTRWRVDPKSTKEFLVKVLDDDTLRSTPKITHAINVNQDAKMLPLDMAHMHTFRSKSPSKTPDDYTRFMMPTTVHTATSKQSYFDEFALKAQKPLRDESPPSGPEFIERANPMPRVQVAPLAPIAFPRRTAYEAPLTPPTGPRQYQTGSMSEKTSNSNLMLPSRTTPLAEYFSNFIYDDSHDVDSKRRPLIQGSSYNSYRTPSMETLTTDLIRTASLEPVALARTSVGQEKEDFYFRRLHVDDENNNQRAAQAAERKSIINSLTSQPKHINNQQIPEHKHRAESSPKDYDSNYNAVHESDDYSTSKKNDLDEDLGIGSSEERDAKMNEDSSSEDANDDFVLLDDIKARAPHRTTESFLINTVPPRTTTVKLDYDSVEVYYEETDNTTIEKMNITEYKKIEGPTPPKRRMLCNLSNQPKHKHENFPKTLSEINEQLRRWAGPSPIAKLMDITNGNFTIMENPIYLVTVDDPSSGQAVMAKQTVMIVAGIGARDHHAVAAAMELLRKLLENTDDHAELLSKHRFLIIPVFNPDGYEYSIGLPHRRNWVKNLRQYWDECTRGRGCEACQSHGLRCTLKPCYGVNLDRNFEYQWIPNEELEAEHPCGPLYAGERQLSELETRALATFLHELDPPLYAFITFKEGEVLGVMYPYSHTKNKRLFDHTYRKNATRAAIAASAVMGRSFVAGQTSEFLPLYAGGMEDWVDGHLGIDRVYSVLMFRPADNLNKQLAPSADNFQKVGQEAFSAVVRLLLPTPGDLMSAPGSLPVIMSRNQPDHARDAAPHATHTTVLLLLALICLELNKTYAY